MKYFNFRSKIQLDQPVETQSLEGVFFNPTSLSFSSSFSSVQNSILPNQNWTFLFRRSSRPRATDPREAGDDDAAQAPRRRSNRRGARRYSARGRPKVLPSVCKRFNTGNGIQACPLTVTPLGTSKMVTISGVSLYRFILIIR